MTAQKNGHIVLVFVLSWLTFLSITTTWVPVLDDADLIFHEAGHVIFSIFGELIYTAGGSLFQILLPLLLAFAFFIKREKTGMVAMLWWAGENMIGVGRYIADARSQQLELIGGEHDWALILSRWPHVMMYDTLIGAAVRDAGIMVMVGSIVFFSFSISRGTKL